MILFLFYIFTRIFFFFEFQKNHPKSTFWFTKFFITRRWPSLVVLYWFPFYSLSVLYFYERKVFWFQKDPIRSSFLVLEISYSPKVTIFCGPLWVPIWFSFCFISLLEESFFISKKPLGSTFLSSTKFFKLADGMGFDGWDGRSVNFFFF